jgi:hypothetical protein
MKRGMNVIACLLDVPVEHVTLDPPRCRVARPNETADLPRWLVQVLAAREVEKIILGLDDPDACQGDERNARVLLEYLIAETGRQQTLESFRQQARDLVIQHRRTIERVAGLLMDAGGMSGRRVSALVKGGGEPPSGMVSIADILLEVMEEQEIADEQTARQSRARKETTSDTDQPL